MTLKRGSRPDGSEALPVSLHRVEQIRSSGR